jgi:hypothetical protein
LAVDISWFVVIFYLHDLFLGLLSLVHLGLHVLRSREFYYQSPMSRASVIQVSVYEPE